MENGYLGRIIVAGTLLLMAFAYWQFRGPNIHYSLDNEFAATVTGFVLTTALAVGITVFAGNVYLTDTFSTIVSSVVVLAAFLVLTVTIARTRTAPTIPAAEPCIPTPLTPETPAANSNKPSSSRRKSRRKAA